MEWTWLLEPNDSSYEISPNSEQVLGQTRHIPTCQLPAGRKFSPTVRQVGVQAGTELEGCPV